jgi:hypothetical protein
VDLHRTLSLGLETLDSVQERMPPPDATIASHNSAAGLYKSTLRLKGAWFQPLSL